MAERPSRNTQQIQEIPVFIDRKSTDMARVIDVRNQAHQKIDALQSKLAKIENKVNG